MIKKIALVICCVLMLSGCGNNDKTMVIDSAKSDEASSDEEFELYIDTGKKFDIFNNKRIVEAYFSGDTDDLTQLENDILTEASAVLEELKKDCDTLLELEFAIHDYIVESATYDGDAVSLLGNVKENSDNPYGILINKKGICSGYTTTFQLFMDMLEVPCIIIYSENAEGEEHAWNQVQIDGKWYYVDCTWDDPVPDEEGRQPYHTYLNITEEKTENTNHVWDKENCYDADSYDANYYVVNAVEVKGEEEVQRVIDDAFSLKQRDVVMKSKEFLAESIYYDSSVTASAKFYEYFEYDGYHYYLYRFSF